MESPANIRATVTATEDRTADVRILTLKPDSPFPYRAGQYAYLHIDGFDPRAYSLATRPSKDNLITLHIRNVQSGLSAKLASLEIGATLNISGPFGTLDAAHALARPVLMIAGGTGISPLLALMQEIIAKGLTEEGITLLYGVRTQDDIYCKPELDALLSSGELAIHLAIGENTPDKLVTSIGQDYAEHAIYVSGPIPMVASVRDKLLACKANPSRILTEDWTKGIP